MRWLSRFIIAIFAVLVGAYVCCSRIGKRTLQNRNLSAIGLTG